MIAVYGSQGEHVVVDCIGGIMATDHPVLLVEICGNGERVVACHGAVRREVKSVSISLQLIDRHRQLVAELDTNNAEAIHRKVTSVFNVVMQRDTSSRDH